MHAAERSISLESLVEDLKQCIPKLSSDAKYAFDPYFYILFWALELPDLASNPEAKYAELKKELLAKLDSEKRGLKEMTVAQDQRSRAKPGSRCAPHTLVVSVQYVGSAAAVRENTGPLFAFQYLTYVLYCVWGHC